MTEKNIKQKTRALLLEKGAEIFHRKGFHHTGINEILAAAAVPKGSFYFYFKNKEDFGLRVIDYFMEKYLVRADVHLVNSRVPYLERFRNFLDEFLTVFEKNGFRGGCPLGNFALEMSDLNEHFREKLVESFEWMKQRVLQFLTPAQQEGELPADINIDEMADFIVNSWEGVLMRIKVVKATAQMQLFYKVVFDALLKKKVPGGPLKKE